MKTYHFLLFVLFLIGMVYFVEAESPFRCEYVVTSEYLSTTGKGGERRNNLHEGIDLWCRDPIIFPVAAGIVSETGIDPIFGKYVIINHGDYYSLYAHGSTIFYSATGAVTTEIPIMRIGSSGYSSGPHLHLGVFRMVGCERVYFDPGEVL